jgi:hypothetical protein
MADNKTVVLDAIDKYRPFLNSVLPVIRSSPDLLTVILYAARGTALIRQEDCVMPVDPLPHPYRDNKKFYFMIIEDSASYEGYLYLLLHCDFHVSLLFKISDAETLTRRKKWAAVAFSMP